MKKQYFIKRTLPMVLAAVLAAAPVQAMAANDLSGHWAEKVITQWQDAGLIKGYADGSFKPNNHVTRAEFVVMMNNALGFDDAADISFGDVKVGNRYYNAVAKAAAAGYSKGYFKPSATITRAEAAVMIANAAGLEADETGVLDFTDAYAIPAWAKGSIGAAVNAGFMSGYTDGSFGAAKSITRAEAVSSLNRVMGGAAEEEAEVAAEDVTVTEDDAVVENRVVNGNLIIDEAVGDGEVYLNDLMIEGDLIVNGGGDDSIYLKNVQVEGKIRVNKKGVRVHMTGETKAPTVEVAEIAQITSENFEGEVGTITIIGDLGTGTRVTIDVPADAVVIEGQSSVAINADITNVTIGEDAAGARLEVGKNATVETVTADAKTVITGTGKVETLEANASGITVNHNLGVRNTETASGVTAPSAAGSSGGSSSSGGGSSGGNSSSTGSNSGSTGGNSGGTGSNSGGTGGSTTETPDEDETTYRVTIEDSAGACTITANPASAKAGDIVTLEVTPTAGYQVVEITYTVDGGEKAEVNEAEGVYSFEMPAGNVKIGGTFSQVELTGYTAVAEITIAGNKYLTTAAAAAERGGLPETVTLTYEGGAVEAEITGWSCEGYDPVSTAPQVFTAAYKLPEGSGYVDKLTEAVKVTVILTEAQTEAELTGFEPITEEVNADEHLTTAEKAAAKLPAAVTLTYEGGTVDAAVTAWDCDGYDGTAKDHTFTAVYTLPAGYKQPAQAVVVTATLKISAAQTVDTTALTEAIAAATAAKDGVLVSTKEGLDVQNGAYWATEAEMNTLNAAIEAATAAEKTVATDAAVTEAVATLNGAVEAFEPKQAVVDVTALTEAIDGAIALRDIVFVSKDGTDVEPGTPWATEDAVNAFAKVITAAEETAAKEDRTQEQVDAAAAALDTEAAAFQERLQGGEKAEDQG